MRGLHSAAVALAMAAAPAHSQADASVHSEHHGGGVYSFSQLEADYSRSGGDGVVNWDGEGWVGSDRDKFWWKTEGEVEGGKAKQAEAQLLYSRNVWTFFDVQVGARVDFEPRTRAYLTAGLQGLAPYLLETELHAFVSDRGDVSLRAKQSFDLRMTNRLIVEPLAEVNFQFQDVPDEKRGSSFEKVEAGAHVRYEFTRRFAPYVGVVYERKLGETGRIARAAGERSGGWTVRTGLRVGF